ncbi:hypothetical protein ACIBCR_01375 [Micromonospora echinospora]|uniref:hypothetical protein n=1 Tax=Micromonospora echinospora TaxID=1877 RepID=UPI0037AB54E0
MGLFSIMVVPRAWVIVRGNVVVAFPDAAGVSSVSDDPPHAASASVVVTAAIPVSNRERRMVEYSSSRRKVSLS